ncbi:hypothetical protein FGO68_gene2181 [Halteria grandinella]|uniref:Uncharacterized protein n=1 Tax=Halteria grandinella TaxID=5974 RepID=A0A8J8P2Q7_HALGN|nr:hypothetical protein FGO68_gene2181 [Halteria grandinella]
MMKPHQAPQQSSGQGYSATPTSANHQLTINAQIPPQPILSQGSPQYNKYEGSGSMQAKNSQRIKPIMATQNAIRHVLQQQQLNGQGSKLSEATSSIVNNQQLEQGKQLSRNNIRQLLSIQTASGANRIQSTLINDSNLTRQQVISDEQRQSRYISTQADVPTSSESSLLTPSHQQYVETQQTARRSHGSANSKEKPYPTSFSNQRPHLMPKVAARQTQAEYAESFVTSMIQMRNLNLGSGVGARMQTDYSSRASTSHQQQQSNQGDARKQRPMITVYDNEVEESKWTEEQAAPMLPPEQSTNSDEYMVYGGAQLLKPPSPQNQPPQNLRTITYTCQICGQKKQSQYFNQYQIQLTLMKKDSQTCPQCKSEMDSARLQQAPSSSQSLFGRPSTNMLTINNLMSKHKPISPRTQKIQMRQIEKKVCHEDSESLLVPYIPSSVLQSIAESQAALGSPNQLGASSQMGLISSNLSGSGGGDMQRKLNMIEESAKIVNSSKNVFEPPQSEPRILTDYRPPTQLINTRNNNDTTTLGYSQTIQEEEASPYSLAKVAVEEEVDMVNLTNNSFKLSSCISGSSSGNNSTQQASQLVLNLENVLYIEDRLSTMCELLKVIQAPSANPTSQQACTSIIELCEDWWEALRSETVLFDVYKIFSDDSTSRNSLTHWVLIVLRGILCFCWTAEEFGILRTPKLHNTDLMRDGEISPLKQQQRLQQRLGPPAQQTNPPQGPQEARLPPRAHTHPQAKCRLTLQFTPSHTVKGGRREDKKGGQCAKVEYTESPHFYGDQRHCEGN